MKATATRTVAQTQQLITSLGDKRYWSSSQSNFTNSYTGDGSSAPYLGKEYMSTNVGDISDTSPYGTGTRPAVEPHVSNPPVAETVINSSTFVSNMANLVTFIAPVTSFTDPAYKN
ncbi:MAG: hypothetical protein V4792_13180 [Pseudomonadota bacterium]